MGQQLGMDVEAGAQLAKTFQKKSSEIGDAISAIDRQLSSTWWKGSDAEKFKSEWNGTHKANLKKAQTCLDDEARSLDKNVKEQTQASN
jgi:uncharacterized protein YukE